MPFLYDRIVEEGTLAEPEGVPDPTFALPSTVNWMRALAVLASKLGRQQCVTFYKSISKRSFNRLEENTVFEQAMFALHQLAALEAIRSSPRKSDVARIGIVTWYYGIYYAASAMTAAQDGSFQDDHASTANVWDKQIAARALAILPFSLRVTSLIEKDAKDQIDKIRAGNSHDLRRPASTDADALGACCAYLSGTSNWYRWRTGEDLKETKAFRELKVENFRTKAARELREDHLSRKTICFLHQASRYRGKANYREALFLGYGSGTEKLLSNYVDDLATVLRAFVLMAGAFIARRVGDGLWGEFAQDVEKNRSFSLSPVGIWS
jgi:hypothetical protein